MQQNLHLPEDETPFIKLSIGNAYAMKCRLSCMNSRTCELISRLFGCSIGFWSLQDNKRAERAETYGSDSHGARILLEEPWWSSSGIEISKRDRIAWKKNSETG